jgi:hypothetical protein
MQLGIGSKLALAASLPATIEIFVPPGTAQNIVAMETMQHFLLCIQRTMNFFEK